MSANLFQLLVVLILGLGVGGTLSTIVGVRVRPPRPSAFTSRRRRRLRRPGSG